MILTHDPVLLVALSCTRSICVLTDAALRFYRFYASGHAGRGDVAAVAVRIHVYANGTVGAAVAAAALDGGEGSHGDR